MRLRSTHRTPIGWFSTGLVSLGLASVGIALPGCGDEGVRGADGNEFVGQMPGTGGGGSELPPPGAAGSSTATETPSMGGSGAGSEMPSSEVVAPVGGVSNGGAPALGEPEPSAAGGSVATIPIIDGPPPPAITFDEFDIPEPSQPGWITAGPDGQIWFAHQSTAPSAISKVTTDGAPFVRYNTSITNTGPRGITFGPDGNVWYTKQGGIGRMQPGGMSTEYGVPNGGDSAGITLGPDGNLWFTQQLGNRISRVTTNGQFTSFDLPAPNSAPIAITTGDDGNLWFTETAVGANKIGRISPNGEITEFAIPTAASNPTGITQGPGAELWFAEQDVAKIGRISPSGEITEFYIPSGNRPSRIVRGPDNNLWFTLRAANAIGRITPLGQVSEYAIPTRASDPYDITVGPDQNLWFTELSSNKIGRLSNFAGGGNVMAVEGGARGEELGGDTPCAKDTDCIESGRACGGDVCGTERTCVLAVSSDPGTCVSDADCWCQSRGATCTEGHCSFVTPGDAP